MSYENVQRNGAIDYMLRTTQQHHVQLSTLADQKANIMIASTSILLTFSFANFKQQNLFWGFLALFVCSFIALILAILAVAPQFGRSREQDFNILFFGHFTELSLDQFHQGLEHAMSSDQATYEAIATDIYNVGKSIKEGKYKYLARSYRVFLAGIVLAGLLFIVQTVVFYFT